MKRFAVALLTTLPLATACTTSDAGNQPAASAPSQRWVCGSEYVNFAWGYQRRGVVLDGEGRVWSYEFKGTPASLPNPWKPKDTNALSDEDLRVRYNGAVDTGKRVDADDIARHIALIIDAANSEPTEGRHVGADMGETQIYCLTRNVPYATYRQVLINEMGDIERTNPSPAAKVLSAWLTGIFK